MSVLLLLGACLLGYAILGLIWARRLIAKLRRATHHRVGGPRARADEMGARDYTLPFEWTWRTFRRDQ